MEKILSAYLASAEANLASYIQSGDERAIRAGRSMVEAFRADLAALTGAA